MRLLKTDSRETEHYVNAVTTNKTLFYRTPRIWSYLTDEFVPAWIKAGHNRPLEVWSGASSTGEEIYTAGMVLEEFRKSRPGFEYRIVGTDVSDRVVEIADKGVYSGRIIDMFKTSSPELFAKYMVGNDSDGYRVNNDIRSRIKFQRHNIFKPFQTRSKYDVSLLRNVLIYFTHEDQERAIANVERSLRPDGLLIIGESETLSPLETNYVCVAPLIYRHRDHKSPEAIKKIGARHVDQAIYSLMKLLDIHEENRRRVNVFIAGGGNMTRESDASPEKLVGSVNAEFAKKVLRQKRLRLIHEEVGGCNARKVIIDCATGEFEIKSIPRLGAAVFSRVQGDLRETIVSGVFKLDDGARLVQILDPFELLNLERLPRVAGALRSGLSRRKRGPRHQCISFKVGSATCAFDMDSIKEIVELEKIDDTTLASEWTLGAIDLRGNTVPVIDFRVYLSDAESESIDSLIERNCKLIVMKMGDNLISLLVDEIENIISYYDDDLLPFPSVGLHRGEMFKGCLGNDEDKMVLLLDHQLVFSDEQVAQVTRGHSALFHEKNEAKDTHTKNKRNRRTLITFRINANFALDIENVSEVIGFPEAVMEPPNLPEYIEGMVNLRGALIPIINLRRLYGLPGMDREQTKLLIFAQGEQKYAIMVDAVESIINVDDSNSGLLPRLSEGSTEDGISKDVKEAILLQDSTVEQSSLMVLDLAAVAARVGGLSALAG
eukprot:g2591.t1